MSDKFLDEYQPMQKSEHLGKPHQTVTNKCTCKPALHKSLHEVIEAEKTCPIHHPSELGGEMSKPNISKLKKKLTEKDLPKNMPKYDPKHIKYEPYEYGSSETNEHTEDKLVMTDSKDYLKEFDKFYGVSKDDDLITTTRYSFHNFLKSSTERARDEGHVKGYKEGSGDLGTRTAAEYVGFKKKDRER